MNPPASAMSRRCPLYPQKQTLIESVGESGFVPKADTQSGRCERSVRCQNALEYDGHVAMKTAAPILFFTLLLTNQSAIAATTTGSSALALASLVGVQSPVLNRHDKSVLTRLLGGHADVAFPANKQISVKADNLVCNAGKVDITAHSCKLTFGSKTADLTGDKAHELYATMAEAGVPSEGSAGAVHESLSHLVCTINPHEIAQKGGGGADCTFDAQTSPAAKSNP